MSNIPPASSLLLLAALALSGSSHAQACAGCVPLDDLGTGLYLGQYEGGLYPAGKNVPPPSHRAAASAAIARILPRDAAGAPSASGWIGLLSITMSNANQEFSAFERSADQDVSRNGRVVVMNGAQGGQALDVIASPNAPYWTTLAQRLDAAGLGAEQVQVVWLKMARASVSTTSFPAHSLEEIQSAKSVLHNLKSMFPNLAIAFFSSRTYGGYSPNPQRNEPLSYETGFSTKWLIEAQIDGDPELNHDPRLGPVVSPLLLWGPYLWANGTIPRSDGLVWLRGDFEGDGVHPSPSGEAKVAGLLTAFFRNDPAARPWYVPLLGARLLPLDATDDAGVRGASPTTNFGAAPLLTVGPSRELAFLKFDLSAVALPIARAELSLQVPPSTSTARGVELRGLSDTSWTESTLTFVNAPPVDGPLHGTLPGLSRGAATAVDVTAAAQASRGGLLSLALVTNQVTGPASDFQSKEGGEAPRLILTLRVGPSAAAVVRNGTGVNPLGFAEVTPATPGTLWRTVVAPSGPGAFASLVAVTVGGPVRVPTAFGELLCAPPIAELNIAAGTHAIAIPYDAALVGALVCTQGVSLVPGDIRLQNALDVRIGF